ncbi:MAG: 16S rRNA (guanine(966)-N(2))-methyltransferase RsmD [Phycisphaerae bacterium]|nr:16S rRNA (guanine(966)-N(2))-methyltransferase RsmD [Phycisphaerae bacterium]
MRVIAGTHRGRLLRGPQTAATRPITDRVKVNLFNILAPRIADAVVADCFCGTGSQGIECLSRGATHATFVEVEGTALRLLRENLEELHLIDQSQIVRADLLRRGIPAPPPAGRFSIVFLDPPYRLTETAADKLWFKLNEAKAAGSFADDVVVAWRHDSHLSLAVPPDCAAAWRIADQRVYGSQTLSFIEEVQNAK